MHLCMDSCLFPRKEFTSLIMCINTFFFCSSRTRRPGLYAPTVCRRAFILCIIAASLLREQNFPNKFYALIYLFRCLLPEGQAINVC